MPDGSWEADQLQGKCAPFSSIWTTNLSFQGQLLEEDIQSLLWQPALHVAITWPWERASFLRLFCSDNFTKHWLKKKNIYIYMEGKPISWVPHISNSILSAFTYLSYLILTIDTGGRYLEPTFFQMENQRLKELKQIYFDFQVIHIPFYECHLRTFKLHWYWYVFSNLTKSGSCLVNFCWSSQKHNKGHLWCVESPVMFSPPVKHVWMFNIHVYSTHAHYHVTLPLHG